MRCRDARLHAPRLASRHRPPSVNKSRLVPGIKNNSTLLRKQSIHSLRSLQCVPCSLLPTVCSHHGRAFSSMAKPQSTPLRLWCSPSNFPDRCHTCRHAPAPSKILHAPMLRPRQACDHLLVLSHMRLTSSCFLTPTASLHGHRCTACSHGAVVYRDVVLVRPSLRARPAAISLHPGLLSHLTRGALLHVLRLYFLQLGRSPSKSTTAVCRPVSAFARSRRTLLRAAVVSSRTPSSLLRDAPLLVFCFAHRQTSSWKVSTSLAPRLIWQGRPLDVQRLLSIFALDDLPLQCFRRLRLSRSRLAPPQTLFAIVPTIPAHVTMCKDTAGAGSSSLTT